VNTLKEYRIPYLGLKSGSYRYEFHLTDTFFDEFEFSEIHGSDLQLQVELEKQSTMIVIHTQLSGGLQSECDHCGDPLPLTISTEQRLLVKFGSETSESDDDVLVLGPNEHEIDLSQYFFEYAHLALPARKVHAVESDCNQDAVKRLEQYKVDQTTNTHWADLKNLNYEDPEDNEFFDEEE
jgi:uncharacterized metal-binding protein YceD (DUF177 family)